jgi:hypothetical protein
VSLLSATWIRYLRLTLSDARVEAYAETGLPEVAFPAGCPWTFDELMAEDFQPGHG